MKIESIGYYLPKATDLKSILDKFPKNWRFPISEKTGIININKVDIGEYSLQLAQNAVEACLSMSQYKVDEIDAIICCNICKYDAENTISMEPATAVSIANTFHMKQAECFDVSNACAGMFTALFTAQSMIKSKTANRVLVVSGEYITRLGETTLKESMSNTEFDPYDLLATLTLSDSAVAMIVDHAPEGVGFSDIQMQTHGEYSHLCLGYPVPNGPLMFTKSIELAQRAASYSTKHIENTIFENEWENEEIRYLIPHQTAERVIHRSIENISMGAGTATFNAENTLVNLKNRGNTSTTTHFVALVDKLKSGELKKEDKLVFSISASGITIGTALYTMDDLPERYLAKTKDTKKSISYPLNHIPVNLERYSIQTQFDSKNKNTFEMIKPSVYEILGQMDPNRAKIGLILFTGMFVSDHISEPAIAAMILREIGLSESDKKQYFSEDLFCYDLRNGSLSTQKAIEKAGALLQSNNMDYALIISSETEQHLIDAHADFPIAASVTALLVSKKEENTCCKLSNSQHFNYLNYANDNRVSFIWEKDNMGISFEKDKNIEYHYLRCMEQSINAYFTNPNSSWNDFDAIAIPAISKEFQEIFSQYFNEIPKDKILWMEGEKDLYTAQTACAIQQWQKQAKYGDCMLQIQVGSGIQVIISEWKNLSS